MGYKGSDMSYSVSDSRLKDNTQASSVKSIPTMTEDYDMGRVQYKKQDLNGYSKAAWDYKY